MMIQSTVLFVLLVQTALAISIKDVLASQQAAPIRQDRLLLKLLSSLHNEKQEPQGIPIDNPDEILLKNLRLDSISDRLAADNEKAKVIDTLTEAKRFYSDWKRRR